MLNTQPNLQACDDFYEALIAAHDGLTVQNSQALNARLILLLANHIGEQPALMHALALARTNTPSGNAPPAAASVATPACVAPPTCAAPAHARI